MASSRATLKEFVRASAPTITLSSTESFASGRTFCQVRTMPSRQTLSGWRPFSRVPLKTHLALRGRVVAGDAVEEGGLPGAVRADEAHDHPLLHREGDVGVGREAAEELGDVLDLEDRHGRSFRPSRPAPSVRLAPRRACASLRMTPSTPSGAKRITTTTRMP